MMPGEQGVLDMPEALYHAHPALSSSGARKLLPPSCPAIYKWERDNPPQASKALDLGTAAHKQVLGVGPKLAVVDAADWRTKAAQEAREQARAAGAVPLLAHEYANVTAMGDALRAHPLASALLDPAVGRHEQSLFWLDTKHGVQRRARLDVLPESVDEHMSIVDYKTTVSAEPSAVARSIANYGYHFQAAWYIDAVVALGLASTASMLFIFQEKTPPYLITVAEPDPDAILVGRAKNDRALEVYAECVATDTWPGYSSGIETVALPAWAA